MIANTLRRVRLVVVAATVGTAVLAAAGCSATDTSAPAGTTVAAPATATSAPRRHGPHPTPGNEALCEDYYHELVVMNDKAELLTMDGPPDTAAVASFIVVVKQGYQRIAELVPPPTRADAEVVNAYVQQASTTAQLADFSPRPDVVQANERYLAWARTTCGFDPNNLAGS